VYPWQSVLWAKCIPGAECIPGRVYPSRVYHRPPRITSYGRKRRGAEGGLERWARSTGTNMGEEVLVTHAFTISDKFSKKAARKEASPAISKEPRYSSAGSLAYGEEATAEEVAFDPDHLEVCLNATGLIAGVAVFLIVQLLLVFLWTHFWQTRNRKKNREAGATLR
jgi:hypothetical protein